LHRIGRTGRFGDAGVALNIISYESEMKLMEQVKEYYKCTINEIKDEDIRGLHKKIDEIMQKNKLIKEKIK